MAPRPHRAIWEITWRCDLRCDHCLVEGGPGGRPELSTDEGLLLVDQLAEIGSRRVTLTGGEPLLRKDWPLLAERVVSRGMELILSTNGHLLSDAVIQRLEDLGAHSVVVSLDGLPTTHDALRLGPTNRRKQSSHGQVRETLARLAESSLQSRVITSVTRQNLPQLPAIHELLDRHGVEDWQIQLAFKAGRARRTAVELMRPRDLPELFAFLERAIEHPRLPPRIHNTIGYLGRTEPLLRPSGMKKGRPFWGGCRCGITSIGIEPDGGIKGCASQVGAPFIVGHAPAEPLPTIWADRSRFHWLNPAPEQMSGGCSPCALKSVCKAGCTALAYGATGELYDNPLCIRRPEAQP